MSCGGFGFHGRGFFNRHYHSNENHKHMNDQEKIEEYKKPILEESNKKNKALNILDEKFVMGEISEEEYIRKKKLLLSGLDAVK
ncbi:hypothetical protein JCM30566_13470 [Marinitoga arctica]